MLELPGDDDGALRRHHGAVFGLERLDGALEPGRVDGLGLRDGQRCDAENEQQRKQNACVADLHVDLPGHGVT